MAARHAGLVAFRSFGTATIRLPRSCSFVNTARRYTEIQDGRPSKCIRHLTTSHIPPKRESSELNGRSIINDDLDASTTVHNELSLLIEQDQPVVQTSDFFPPPSLQEDLHIASTTNHSAGMKTHSTPRLIRIRQKDISDQQIVSSSDNTPICYRESLDGYKYRIMKTPQLTNNVISSQVPDNNPAIDHLEKNEYGHYFNQNNNPSPTSLGLQQSLSDGLNGDILSSNWWRTLYRNVVYPSVPRHASNNHPFQSASMRNRRASISLEEIISNTQHQFQDEEEENCTSRIRVRSVQAASSIDVVAVLSKVFGGGIARTQQSDMNGIAGSNKLAPSNVSNQLSEFFVSSPPVRHVFGRTNIIIQLSPPPSDCPPSLAPCVPRYIAIYRFGSVVFFNVTTSEASKLLEQIKKHSIDPIAVGFERREFFEIGLQPQLETATGAITADRAMVRELDMNTVGVVSNIMGRKFNFVVLKGSNDKHTNIGFTRNCSIGLA